MKVRRRLVAVLAVVCGVIGLAVAAVPVAGAASGPIFTVMNTSESLPDGVYFRNSPHTADTSRITGLGVYKNERVQLQCYATGDAVGAFNDKLWYYVNNVTRPTVSGRANVGYLNAHYINDGKNANVVDAGVPKCGAPTSPATVINGVNVGYPQNGKHTWGSGCTVQDFNGGPYGTLIVGYSNGTNIVRNGMLAGWFDNGGGPGLGCPVNQEHSYSDGLRQDFTHGSLYWASGMNHASKINWTDTRSPIWSGYAGLSTKITYVRASWTIPSVTCPTGRTSYSSLWAGIDGGLNGSSDLVQAGSESNCTPKPDYHVWWQTIPGKTDHENQYKVTVRPGEAVSVDISYGTNNRYSIQLTVGGVKQALVASSVVGKHVSAECVVEAPIVNRADAALANFGSAAFNSCQMAKQGVAAFPIITAPSHATTLARFDMQKTSTTPLRATPGLPRTQTGPWSVLFRAS